MTIRKNHEWDWLVFGAHPDDVEIGAGGLIISQRLAGKNVVICDLTHGEMSSNGDPLTRQQEALASAKTMGVSERICLGLKDRGIKNSEEELKAVVQIIRQYSPKYVLCPYHKDSHPDHRQAAQLVREAVFNACLSKYGDGKVWRVKRIWEYFINDNADYPIYLKLPIEVGLLKMQALQSYQSQFNVTKGRVPTRLHSFLERIERRDRYFGDLLGVDWAEGFYQREEIAVQTLEDLV